MNLDFCIENNINKINHMVRFKTSLLCYRPGHYCDCLRGILEEFSDTPHDCVDGIHDLLSCVGQCNRNSINNVLQNGMIQDTFQCTQFMRAAVGKRGSMHALSVAPN